MPLISSPLKMTLFQSIAVLAGRDAEQRHLAAVIHHLEHGGEGRGHAGHFQADIEAFDHAELGHHIGELLLGDVDGAAGAHLARQIQAVIVDVGHHHMARADMLGDGDRHDADGTGAGDRARPRPPD